MSLNVMNTPSTAFVEKLYYTIQFVLFIYT